MMPTLDRESNIPLKGENKILIGGFFPPIQNATTTQLSLYQHTLDGKIVRASVMGHTVRLEDLKGNMPSVLKAMPHLPALIYSMFPATDTKCFVCDSFIL